MTPRETGASSLSPERWRELEPLLDAALALSAKQRAAFLGEACGGDVAMRQELLTMLSACERLADSDPLLEQPAAERFATLWEEPHELSRLASELDGRYVLESETGRGGMAFVYRAQDLRHRRPVAFKVLRTALLGQGPARFRREIALAANLQHPHILPVFDSGESAGRLWYTMPFVDGESLGARLRRERRLEIPEAVRLLREIADALRYAHERGVVHRDLKPDNVLLSNGHAVIADFGVAKAFVAARGDERPERGSARDLPDSVTGLGVSVGTPAYMAPEQAAADPAVDHRADLYALGVIAYQMLAGVTPFTGATPQALFAAILAERPVQVSTHRSDVPMRLEGLVMRLLEKNAHDRPQSAADVIAELDTVDTVAGASLPSSEWAARNSNRIPWLKSRWLVAATITGVAVGGAAWYGRTGPTDSTERRVLVVPLENQTGDSSLTPLGRIASEWIEQELTRIGSLEVVSGLPERPTGGETALRAVVAESHAGTIVSGAYYLEGDSIRFQPSVTDVARWKLLAGVRAARAPRSNPTATLDTVAERVMAVIARAHDPRAKGWDIGAPPPTYEALNQFHLGLDLFVTGNWKEAIPYWERAAKLESSYAQPVLHLIIVHANFGEDSVAHELQLRLEKRRDSLTPFDRAMLDASRTFFFEPDAGANLAAAQAMAAAAPAALLPRFFISGASLWTNRPQAALDAFERLPYEQGRWKTGWSAQLRWKGVTDAYHMLGRHKTELDAARTATRVVPGQREIFWNELRAMAALGMVADMQPKLDTLEQMAPVPWGRAIPALLFALADELEAHGHPPTAATDVRRRAIVWLENQPPDEQRKPDTRFAVARAHYYLGEYAVADSILSSLVREEPQGRYLTYQGLIAARRGHRTEAERISERLRTSTAPYDRQTAVVRTEIAALTALARAEIAAQLGDTASALTLTSQAVTQSMRDLPALHALFDLKPLRDYPRFKQLIKPKG